MTFNLSKYDSSQTAKTCLVCARQRAENLFVLGVKSVLELCVGPSLLDLEQCYRSHGITVYGNDIDSRWQRHYPQGNWLVGDARAIKNDVVAGFDAVVVAPPLSQGCSGKRQDSLSLNQVFPRYTDFFHLRNKVIVFVLPGRTLSLKDDTKQLHEFISRLHFNYTSAKVSIVPLKNKVTKYVDIYLET